MRPWWIVCLWPGLAPIAWRGAWGGLLLAVTFAAFLNLLLVSTLIYTELVSHSVLLGGWCSIAVFWILSVVVSKWWLARQMPAFREQRTGALFSEALAQYLLGHWPEAEHRLRQVLRQDERDVDAGLYLATLLRRTGRWDEARTWLDRLDLLAEAGKWHFELARERQQLQAEREAELEDEDQANTVSEDVDAGASEAESADEASAEEPATVRARAA